GLPFTAGQAFVGDGGLAEIALGQVHLPLAGVGQVGGKCGADERAEQKQACLHVYPPFDFAIMARLAMECKGRSRFSRNVYLRLRVRYCPPPGTEIHLAEALPADQRLRAYAQRIAHAHHHVPASSAKRSRPGDSARLEDKWKNWGSSDAEIKGPEYWTRISRLSLSRFEAHFNLGSHFDGVAALHRWLITKLRPLHSFTELHAGFELSD